MKKKNLIIIIVSILALICLIIIISISINNRTSNKFIVLNNEFDVGVFQTSKLVINQEKKTIRLYIDQNTTDDLSYLRIKLSIYDDNNKIIYYKSINYDVLAVYYRRYIEVEYDADLSSAYAYSFDTDTVLHLDGTEDM